MFCTTKNFYDDLLSTCSTLEAPSSSDLFIVLTCNWISCDIVSVSISGVMGLYFQKKLKTNDQTKHFISASNSHATRMTVHDQQNSAFKNVSVWKIKLAVTIKIKIVCSDSFFFPFSTDSASITGISPVTWMGSLIQPTVMNQNKFP